MPEIVNELIEYSDGSGLLLKFPYDGETMWLTVAQIAVLFGTTRRTIERHIQNIYAEEELLPDRTRTENVEVVENRPNMRVSVYNLDVVISVGYRVKSTTATQFRQWATQIIKQRATNDYSALAQDEAIRILLRSQLDDDTDRLVHIATFDHHVTDEESFLAAGDQGLYHASREDIESERNVPPGRLYDFIGPTEMGMHVYRLTQTAEALKSRKVQGDRLEQDEAEEIHSDIAGRTRADSHLNSGKYPEELPVAENLDYTRLRREQRDTLTNSEAAEAAAKGEQLGLLDEEAS